MAFDNGSPYSDFEDMLYDADPGQDLADDLAEHTMHSPPIYFMDDDGDDDIGGFDLGEGYSDWEYYSDDYWDDDPALLKRIGNKTGNTEGMSDAGKENGPTQEPVRRGRKRKINEVEHVSKGLDLGERKRLKDCIKGTVWATPTRERQNWYKEGEQEKVALLKDWEKKFGTYEANVNHEKPSKPSMRRDESWANEMSLADMGLTATHDDRLAGRAEEENEDDYDDTPRASYGQAVPVDEDDGLYDIERTTNLGEEQETDEYADASLESEPGKPPVHLESDRGSIHRKRRRKQDLPSPSPSNETGIADTPSIKKVDLIHDDSHIPSQQNRSKKRKASEDRESITELELEHRLDLLPKSKHDSYNENSMRGSKGSPEPAAKDVKTESSRADTDGNMTKELIEKDKHLRKKVKGTKGSQAPTEVPRRSTRATRSTAGN